MTVVVNILMFYRYHHLEGLFQFSFPFADAVVGNEFVKCFHMRNC